MFIYWSPYNLERFGVTESNERIILSRLLASGQDVAKRVLTTTTLFDRTVSGGWDFGADCLPIRERTSDRERTTEATRKAGPKYSNLTPRTKNASSRMSSLHVYERHILISFPLPLIHFTFSNCSTSLEVGGRNQSCAYEKRGIIISTGTRCILAGWGCI